MKRWTTFAPLAFVAVAIAALAAAVRAEELPPIAIALLGTHTFRHAQTVSALAFSADGTRLASASWDKSACVWDAATGRRLSRFAGHQDGASAVALSPDGRLVASGDMNRTTVLWDAATGKEIHRTADNPNTVFWLSFSADGKRLAWASAQRVRIWNVTDWREERSIATGVNVRPVAWSPDGKTIAAGCGDGSIQLRNADDGSLTTTLTEHGKGVFALAFHPDGRRLLSGGSDGAVRLWDLTTAAQTYSIKVPDHWVHPVAFIGKGDRFVVGRQDGTVGVYDTATGASAAQPFATTGRRDAWTMAMAVTPDGKTLATSGTELAIRLWDTTTFTPLDTPGHTAELTAACFADDGKTVITAAQDGAVRFWDAATGRALRHIDAGGTVDVRMSASADAKHLAIRSDDDHLYLCDVERAAPPASISGAAEGPLTPSRSKLSPARTVLLPKSAGGANSLALSPDAALVAATCGHDTVRVIDTKTGDERFLVHTDPRQWAELPMAFAPDSRLLAIASGDPDKKYVTLIDTLSGHVEGQLPVGAAGDDSLAFTPDGAGLAVACRNQPIRLVEIATRRVRAEFPGDGDAGTCLAISPDGRLLAAGGGPDRPTVRVWNLLTGRQIRKFTGGHTNWLKSVAFSPDSKRLVSTSRDTTAIVWDVSTTTDNNNPDTPPTPDAAALADAWSALAGDDPIAAYRAIAQLAAAGDAGVAFLAGKFTPSATDAATQDAHIASLVAALDADRYADRESARKSLARIGQAAAPALRKALANGPTAEVRTRLEVLLAALDRTDTPSPDLIRDLRAVEALHLIHTPKAAEALHQIATTRAGTRVAQAARAK